MIAALHAAADWNANKAAALFRQHHFEKNTFRAEQMLSDYVRLTRNADHIRRQAWVLEHRR